MTVRPRALLATDLDGTLLDADGNVSPRTRAALDRARASELDVVFVTGRPPMFLSDLAEQTGHQGQVICANGAMVFDLGLWRPVWVRTMSADDLGSVVAAVDELDPAAGYRVMMHRATDEPIRLVGAGADYHHEVRERMAEGWLPFKVAVYGNEVAGSPDDFHAAATSQLGHLAEVTHSIPSVPFLEIGPLGVHKGSALARHAAALDLDQAAVHAVGDMPNDVSMLTWAGHSYAVANAHPAVKEAAATLLPANTDDGVAQLIESLLD